MADRDHLERTLRRIDGAGYKAYKDIQGSYDFDDFDLHIDHVQGDPFATPSKLRVRVPMNVAELPAELFNNVVRRLAFEDYLARQVNHAIRKIGVGERGSGKSGLITIDAGRQEVLLRTAVVLRPEWVEARLQVGLPARGRRILGCQAQEMLCEEIPEIVESGLHWRELPQRCAREFVECIENQEHIREQLDKMGLVAFVADGSILPRESGATDRPMKIDKAVPFKSPESLRCDLEVLNPVNGSNTISGMGISKGVTLIVGGGYHGKSTLLQALELGVYPHIPNDGRAYVVTLKDAVKVRAEDRRRVENVDIASFISHLPRGTSTKNFCTEDASGSTSQAANIIEAIEVGATTLMLDEDTSATNFMVRDARMQALVHKDHEPITPYLDRVREIYEKLKVSTVLVMGGCGDYFDVADTVIMMRDYLPHDVTDEARRIASEHITKRAVETRVPLDQCAMRIPLPESFNASRGRRDIKIDARELDLIRYGEDNIDLRGIEQLVDYSQTNAVGNAIYLATKRFMSGKETLREVLDKLDEFLKKEGLDVLDPFYEKGRNPGNFALPRKYEIAAAINRLRSVRMKQI